MSRLYLCLFYEIDFGEMPQPNPIFDEIHQHLNVGCSNHPFLSKLSQYYFDGRGKSIRPKLTETMAEAVNCHLGLSRSFR
jgi:geranylgeranyl pyrophosphate synthase